MQLCQIAGASSNGKNRFFVCSTICDRAEALAISEFYGFARLGFMPCDITMNEKELQQKYSNKRMRVPEFVAGNEMVEVKRLTLEFDIAQIVKKACEKAHASLVFNEKVNMFYICYVFPQSMSRNDVRLMQKLVKTYTFENAKIVHTKNLKIVFVKAPDLCFLF